MKIFIIILTIYLLFCIVDFLLLYFIWQKIDDEGHTIEDFVNFINYCDNPVWYQVWAIPIMNIIAFIVLITSLIYSYCKDISIK